MGADEVLMSHCPRRPTGVSVGDGGRTCRRATRGGCGLAADAGAVRLGSVQGGSGRDSDQDGEPGPQGGLAPPDELVVAAGELGQDEAGDGVDGGVADDHQRQAGAGAVVQPGQDHRLRDHQDQELGDGPLSAGIGHEERQVPQPPDHAEEQGRAETGHLLLQAGQGVAAPADLLEQPDDHHGGDEGGETAPASGRDGGPAGAPPRATVRPAASPVISTGTSRAIRYQ